MTDDLTINFKDDFSDIPQKRVRRPRATYSPPPFQTERKSTKKAPPKAPKKDPKELKKDQNAPKKGQDKVPFRPSRYLQKVYDDDDGRKPVDLRFKAWLKHNFDEVKPQLTCYRHHHFEVIGSINLNDKQAHLINGKRINVFKLGAVAKRSSCDEEMPLLQYTRTRNKGTAVEPVPIGKIAATLDRMHFKFAYDDDGEKKINSQQTFVVISQLFAELENGEHIMVATCDSEPIIVRGRFPASYFDADLMETQKRSPARTVGDLINHLSEASQNDKHASPPSHQQTNQNHPPVATHPSQNYSPPPANHVQMQNGLSTVPRHNQSYAPNSYQTSRGFGSNACESNRGPRIARRYNINQYRFVAPRVSPNHRYEQNEPRPNQDSILKLNTNGEFTCNREAERMVHLHYQQHEANKNIQQNQHAPLGPYVLNEIPSPPVHPLPSSLLQQTQPMPSKPLSPSHPVPPQIQMGPSLVPQLQSPQEQKKRERSPSPQPLQQQKQPKKSRSYLHIGAAVALVKQRLQRPDNAQHSAHSEPSGHNLKRSDKSEQSRLRDQSDSSASSKPSKLSEQQRLSELSDQSERSTITKAAASNIKHRTQ